jgi:hypothetical protein
MMRIYSRRWAAIFRRALAVALTGVCGFPLLAENTSREPTGESLETMSSSLAELELLQQEFTTENALSLEDAVEFKAPEMAGESPVRSVVVTPTATELEQQSRAAWQRDNWLLAGMEAAQAPELRPGESESVEDSLEPVAGSAEHWLVLAAKAVGDGAATEELAAERVADELAMRAVNPLEDFMRDWLDSSLAVSDLGADSPSARFDGIGEITGARLPADTGRAERLMDVLTIDQLGANAESNRRNPYTVPREDAFEGLPDAVTGLPDLPGTARRAESPPLGPIFAPSSPAVNPPRESAKPSREPWRPPEKDDDKYFQQLNQF